MQNTNNDQVFHPISEQELIEIISYSLRKDHGYHGASVKEIAKQINLNPRLVRNWYEAKNAPSLANFLRLIKCSPSLMKRFLELLNNGQILSESDAHNHNYKNQNKRIYGDNSVTVNVTLRKNILLKLNQRQLWFLGFLQKGISLKVDDIINIWDVNIRTAKRDIAGLIDLKLIEFSGAPKNGKYIPI